MIDTMFLQNDPKWIAENVTPYKKEIDDFLEKVSHPDKDKIKEIVQEAHTKNEIPKIINFCFVNYKELLNCYYPTIHSWIENLKDYFFINWTPATLPDCNWSKQMLENKSWAFYADYARAYAVYNVGGFYIDCDVFVYKSFNDFLQFDHVFDLEYNSLVDPIFVNRIDAGIFGAKTHCKFMKFIVDKYKSINEDIKNFEPFVAPFLWGNILEKSGYTILYNTDLDVAKKIFNSNSLPNNYILALNSSYFSRPNTKLINRSIVPQRIGIREIEIESYAYASHQMFSEWVPK